MSGFNSDLKKEIVNEVERALISRARAGTLKSEVDFIMGASSVMRIVNIYLYEASEESSMDCIPPMWLMWAMSGRSIVEEIKEGAQDD